MRLLFMFSMAPITAAWYGFTLSVMWGWFIVPVFHVDPIRVPYAIGLAYIVQWLTHPTNKPDNDPELEHLLVMAIVRPLVLLFAGWVVTWFI